MPFGRSKSLRSKRSNVGPTKEDNISTPRFVSTDAQPRSDLHLLRTSTLFPDGGPDIVPTPARTGDDLHLLRTSTLFPGGCPDLSSFGTKVNTERPRTADDRSGGDPIEQSLIRPRPAHQVSDPSKYRAPLQRNRSEPDGEEMVIGMALGDPEEDSSWTTKDQSPANHHSSNEPSTTSSTPIPHAERQLDSHGVGHGIDALKRKPSKWKTLGGIFGKRNISPASSTTQFHQIQHDSQPASHQETRITSHRTSPPQRVDVPMKTETSGVVHRGKGRNHRRKSSRLTKTKEGTRPDFRRARTAPQLHLEEQRQTPLTKDANADNTFPKLHLEGQPMLSVDLPDVQLDRYSIMFSGLLNPSLPSSLLVRRHAHLDNVKTDGNEGKVMPSLCS